MNTFPTWVIGGSSGIGSAVAKCLEMDGGAVYITGKENCDVRNVDEIALSWQRFEDFYKDFYKTELASPQFNIVYSAGTTELEWIGNGLEDAANDIFSVNVIGFIRLIDFLRSRNISNVRLVAITSDAAIRPLRTSISYCASKAALNMAVRCAARELAAAGWRVNGIAPGMTYDTGMTAYVDATVPPLRGWTTEETAEYENRQSVIRRRAFPSEIADMVRMVLYAPDYYNGDILTINGGR